ncbi:hypothetical protein OsI_10991 [Oryza sativa Indica Group]|uniref:VOC domain-containing protein n=1 Tax=Oryza sativa subsp. indica TaxID=39946 RepID=B8AL24_ORYSI|nr:hypothetical protein OsI_10991 [Oryza sativa Indica Group]
MTMTMSNEQGKPEANVRGGRRSGHRVHARHLPGLPTLAAAPARTNGSSWAPGKTEHCTAQHKRRLQAVRDKPQQASVMASEGAVSPAFAYTVVYVKDVAKSAAFYSAAFGYTVRRLDQSHKWAELESGTTTIAFTPLHQRETDALTGAVQLPDSAGERGPVEICFDYADVDAAYRRAHHIVKS